MKKIIIEDKHSIEVKRLYIPHTIESKCPNCGADIEFLGDDYMSYPTLNEEEMVYSSCYECDSDYELPIKLGMTLEFDINKIKNQ